MASADTLSLTANHHHTLDMAQDAHGPQDMMAANVDTRSADVRKAIQKLTAKNVPIPKDEDIIRQVEFYFSDKNLAKDKYLRGFVGNTENRPVSVNTILKEGFDKMRGIVGGWAGRPLLVEALKKSTTLNISGKKKEEVIQRRIPYIHDPDVGSEDEQLENEDEFRMELLGVRPIKVPKKKKPQQPKPKAPAATGFEPFYADRPITPAEYKEEQALYHPDDCTASERINTALYRFTQRRTFHSENKNVFDKFLKFGGINATPRMFGNHVTAEQLKEEGRDPAYIAQCMSTYSVGDDKDVKGVWSVEFETVAKAFFSSHILDNFDLRMTPIHDFVRVIDNFLRYLIMHDVCLDFLDDIHAARHVVTLAGQELPAILDLTDEMPGAFNKALSILSGGSSGDWDEDPAIKATRREKSKFIAHVGLIACAPHDIVDAVEADPEWHHKLTRVDKKVVELKVSGIERASEESKSVFVDLQGLGTESKLETFKPLGTLTCKPFTFPTFKVYDYRPRPKFSGSPTTYTFHVEEDILARTFIGLKLEAIIYTIQFANGARFEYLDTVDRLSPSYYTLILNDLVKKPIREVELMKDKVARDKALVEAQKAFQEAANKEAEEGAKIEAAVRPDAYFFNEESDDQESDDEG